MLRFRLVSAVAAAVVAVALLCSLAFAARTAPRMNILLKDGGITAPKMTMAAGNYTVVVKNFSSTPRGIQLVGIDKGGSQYTRYSKVIPKGGMDTFGFYFPPRRSVVMRDVLKCERAERNCMIATYGGHRLTMRFR